MLFDNNSGKIHKHPFRETEREKKERERECARKPQVDCKNTSDALGTGFRVGQRLVELAPGMSPISLQGQPGHQLPPDARLVDPGATTMFCGPATLLLTWQHPD